jgi:hypothetical protein
MQAKGFFASLFDFSFRSFVTPKIIKVLYVLMTVVVALWTLALVLWAFRASTGAGILTLVILAPIFFVIAMIYVRVGLELLIVFFRIHGDVEEINRRGGGGSNGQPAPSILQTAALPTPVGASEPTAVTSTPAPAAEEAAATRFCAGCGAEQPAGKRFCTACGEALE